jgi:hypothetical protein
VISPDFNIVKEWITARHAREGVESIAQPDVLMK